MGPKPKPICPRKADKMVLNPEGRGFSLSAWKNPIFKKVFV